MLAGITTRYFRLPTSTIVRDYGLGLWLSTRETSARPPRNSPRQPHLHLRTSPYVRRTLTCCVKKGVWQKSENERKAIQQLDETNAFAQAERLIQAGALTPGHAGAAELLDRDCAHHPQGYLELATEYFRLSAWEEAAVALQHGVEVTARKGEAPYPLLLYYRAYAMTKLGDQQAARKLVEEASKQDLKLVIFPFRAEDVKVLRSAMRLDPNDANAASLLGDLLYSRNRQEEATQIWKSCPPG